MKHSALALALVASLPSLACGGGDGGGPAADDPSSSPDAEAAATAGGPVNSFTFTATGASPAADLPTASELTLGGGCAAPSPMSIGFLRGTPTDDTYFHFSMESEMPVPPGHTGEVELVEVVWDNGVEMPANVPEDSPIRVPSRLEGTGTLTIESHSGRGMGGNMSGTVVGTLTDDDTGEPVTIDVAFDINLACAG